MTEENLAATSLQIEDVSNPQSVSFAPDPKEPPKDVKPPTAREAIEKSLADIEAKDGKRLPNNPRDEKGASSFQVVNSSMCYVRLKGFKDSSGSLVEGEGWLLPPGHVGVYATQQPARMMALAVARPGYPVSPELIVPLEVNYGYGL